MISTGDTAFILICAALVAIMTPGVAFFYGGLVRRKNFLAIMMQSFISMGVVTVIRTHDTTLEEPMANAVRSCLSASGRAKFSQYP